MEQTDNVKTGKIVQVMGPVVDVAFDEGDKLPDILDALVMSNPAISAEANNLTVEVSLHIGDNTVRCIAMDSTDGLTRGQPVTATGSPILTHTGTDHRRRRASDRRTRSGQLQRTLVDSPRRSEIRRSGDEQAAF
jgi:F0F1-type ATP synthase beta subunit